MDITMGPADVRGKAATAGERGQAGWAVNTLCPAWSRARRRAVRGINKDFRS